MSITADGYPLITTNIDAFGRWKVNGVVHDGTWVIVTGPPPAVIVTPYYYQKFLGGKG
jgi:hypothetical protein